MMTTRLSVAFLACVAASAPVAFASEPGSGVYARSCAAVEPTARGEVIIDISADGSAEVTTGGAIYPDLLTSYSFFGDATPAEFLIAVMFGPDASPLPAPPAPDETGPGWIEIWNGTENFFALENGQPEARLEFCHDLALLEAPSQSVDCAAAASGMPRLICETPQLSAIDNDLALVLEATQDNIDAADLPALTADQEGWSAGRDTCLDASAPIDCLMPLYQARIAYLGARYGQASAGAELLYACEGGDIGELRVTPFDTDPASVTLTDGAQSVTMLQTVAASGARYMAPDGAIFWSKGNEAMLEWPAGSDSHCVLR